MKTGAVIAISVGVIAVGVIAFFTLKKKKSAPYQPAASKADIGVSTTAVPADKKKKNTALIVGAVAGLGALATALLLKGKNKKGVSVGNVTVNEKDCLMADEPIRVGICGSPGCSERDTASVQAGHVIGKFMYETGGYIFCEGPPFDDPQLRKDLGAYIFTFPSTAKVKKVNCGW